MAQTTGGALTAFITSLGLGVAVGRDRPTQGAVRPYVTITEEISLVPDPLEDGGPSTAVEMVQVDLWQDFRDLVPGSVTYGNLKENYTLAPALKRSLHGTRLTSLGSGPSAAIVYMALVRHSTRFVEEADNVVHHAITLDVFRQL
jgi:hypothetical protein